MRNKNEKQKENKNLLRELENVIRARDQRSLEFAAEIDKEIQEIRTRRTSSTQTATGNAVCNNVPPIEKVLRYTGAATSFFTPLLSAENEKTSREAPYSLEHSELDIDMPLLIVLALASITIATALVVILCNISASKNPSKQNTSEKGTGKGSDYFQSMNLTFYC